MRHFVLTIAALAAVGLAAGTALAGHGPGPCYGGRGYHTGYGYRGYAYGQAFDLRSPSHGKFSLYMDDVRRIKATYSQDRYLTHPRSLYNGAPRPYYYWAW